MSANRADFTLTFRRLCDAVDPQGRQEVRKLFADPTAYDSWAMGWHRRLEMETVAAEDRAAIMRMASPAFIPRNHRVEAAIEAAIQQQNFQPFEELLEVMSRPFEERPELERYGAPAAPRSG